MNTAIFLKKGFLRAALVSVVAVGAFGASSSFAAPVSTTATTSATVVAPIAIAQAQNLAFGEFAAGTGGTIILTTGGGVSSTSDVVITGGTPTAAQFTVTGQTDASFSIAITDNELTHATDTTATMTFTPKWDLDAGTQNSPTSATLLLGSQTIYVGGTLDVGATQASGAYSGTVTATVNYN